MVGVCLSLSLLFSFSLPRYTAGIGKASISFNTKTTTT